MSYELVSQDETDQFRTAADGVGVEKREVKRIVRKKSITAWEEPNQNGTTTGVLTFLWGGLTHIKSLSSPKVFYCEQDTLNRSDIPGKGGERVQSWVYMSPWSAYSGFNPA
jgi:hypothetical protein